MSKEDSMASNIVRSELPTAARAGLSALLALALVGLTAPTVHAQAGQVTGVVTNAQTGAALSEVRVYRPGLDRGAPTRADGRFLILNVPAGTHDLRAERIGFGGITQTVTVTAGGTATVNFSLETQALGLDEIVVTGTAGAATRREIGNTISQISVDDVPDAPRQVSDMLQAQAPGLDVYGGGAIGQAKIIRLRGQNSALLSSHPIIYVDGVRMRSEPVPDANPPDRRGGRSGNIAVSPLDQINPNDIERIEIIKGSAATTLYGTEAAGGVIQVFTKRGTGGAPIWTAEVGTGTEWSRAFGVGTGDIPGGLSNYDQVLALTEENKYNNMEHWLCTGIFDCGDYAHQSYNQDYSLSVRGGSGGVNYFLSGGFGDRQGYQVNDTEQKYTLRGNLGFSPTPDLQIQWNTGYANTFQTHTAGQNNAQGITLNAFRAERNYFGTGDPAVLDELLLQELDENVERFTTGATITYSPIANLSNRFVVGYDWTQREHRNLRPYGWEQVPEGALLNNTFQNRVLSLDYVGSYEFDVTSEVQSTFSWGGQTIGDDSRLVEGFGENFPGAAQPTINSAATTLAFEERSKIWNAGFFFQNVLDVSNRYFLTLGVRVDGNSTFGSGFGLQVYPKASASWILSDEAFYPDWGEMKLRFALGQSGRAPGAFDAVQTWEPEGLAGIPAFVPQNVGNPDIGPEVTTEIEGGFDASWFDNRVSTTFTYYYQRTDDALFNVPQLPSGGSFDSQLTNIGKLKNSGIEVSVDANVLQAGDWGVDLGVNVSTNKSEILELNDESLETNTRRVGYPIRVVVDERIANPDASASSVDDVQFVEPGDPEFQGTGTSANAYFWGSNLPETFINPSITVRAPKGITLNARGEYKGGFYMNEQVFAIGRAVRSPLCFPYYTDPANNNTLRDGIPALWYARCNTVDTEGYVWDGTYFKLRSVSATIPVDFAFPDRVGTSLLTIALNNSWLWMKEMPFMDPETSTDPSIDGGPQQGYGFEETVPPPMSLRISLRVTF
jgi:TonB-linked SusC/RagA family outer membrane protein